MAIVNSFVWADKYRPKTIDECILTDEIKSVFKEYISKGDTQHLLLAGSPGTGKTSSAFALCHELGAEVLYINASKKNGIDVVRTEITQFASTISLTGQMKVIILDEAERLNASSTQMALRAFIEEFSGNCKFIFTCNYKAQIIDALQSRCKAILFTIKNKDKPALAAQFFVAVKKILDKENIEYDKRVVAEIINKFFPDFRRTLNELQGAVKSGKIDSSALLGISSDSFKDLFKLMKEKKFNDVRKWVAENIDSDPQELFEILFKQTDGVIDIKSVPQLVLILADYQYKAAFVANHEINTMACLTEIMGSCTFI